MSAEETGSRGSRSERRPEQMCIVDVETSGDKKQSLRPMGNRQSLSPRESSSDLARPSFLGPGVSIYGLWTSMNKNLQLWLASP